MRNMRGFLCLGVSMPVLAALVAVSPAGAQGFGVEEIVVTAQKREENLQDVPIAVSAFSSAALEARGATALSSLFQAPPPGVVMQPFGGSQTMLIVDIRGINNSDPGQGTMELGTAIYIDDVYMGRGQGLGAELVDPERIEVLRGPQGTLFGRNAEGGAIRIVTKKPTGEWGGNGRVQFGNFNQQRYEGHLNLPSIAGFAIKLDYLNSSHDGWTKNGPRVDRLDAQKDFGELDAEGYRGSVRWQPHHGITVDYSYDHSVTKDVRDYDLLLQPPMGFAPEGPLTPLATFTGARPIDSARERVDQAWLPVYAQGFRTKTSGHTLQGSWDINDALTLRSITAIRKTTEDGAGQHQGVFNLSKFANPLPLSMLVPGLGTTSLGLDPATQVWGISGIVPSNNLDQKQESQEFQLVGSLPEVEFVVGAYYFHEQVTDSRQTLLSIIYTDPDFTQAVGVNPFTVGPGGPNSQEAESTSYAGFAQATWSPGFANDRLHLTGGIRYTSDKKTFVRTLANGAPVNIVGEPFREKRWDPAFTIAYDITDDINAYTRYAQAYRAGGVSVRSPTFRPFGAEVNKAFELGIKSDLLDRRLRVNAALFENRLHNRQLTAQLDPSGDPSINDVLNAPGVTRIRGGELEIVAVPTQGLQISATYAYLHGKRPISYTQIDPNAELRIQSLPEHAITAAIDYTRPLADIGDLVFHLDYSMASKTPGTVRVPYGAYAPDIERNVANARVALQNIRLGSLDWKLAVFGKNLFDTAYPTFTTASSTASLSLPRTYGIELGVAF